MQKRRFRILDAVVLTASLGVSFAICRDVLPENVPLLSITAHEFMACFRAVVLSLAFSLALLICFDSASLRDSCRSPGKLSVVLVSITAAVPLLAHGYELLIHEEPIFRRVLTFLVEHLLSRDLLVAPTAIVAGWLTLYLTGTAEHSNDWLGAAGLIIGIALIAFSLAFDLFYFYEDVLFSMGVTMS